MTFVDSIFGLSMDIVHQFFLREGRDANGILRQRLRESGFRFCDETQSSSTNPFTREQYEEAPELRCEGIRASSTDHETQARLPLSLRFLKADFQFKSAQLMWGSSCNTDRYIFSALHRA